MLKNVNMPCTYSSNYLTFPDGTEFTGFTPGIRGTADFVVRVIEDDGNFKVPGSDLLGRPPRYTKCRIQGHYADESPDQLVSLFCDDLGPLAGIDQAPERVDVVSGQPSESKEDKVRDARALLESAGFLITEAKKTFDTFMSYLMSQDGRCSADGGESTFYSLKLNDENFSFNLYEFEEQIKKEGLYDSSWVAGIIPNKELESTGGKIPVSWLPIFGRRDKYETKWLQNETPAEAVSEALADRRMGLKKRIDYFAVPAEDALSLKDLKSALESQLDLPCNIRSDYKKGDYLETTLDFTPEECEKLGSIPTSSGYYIVWLINNKFVINKMKYGSVEKVVNFFNAKIEQRAKLGEAREVLKRAGIQINEDASYRHDVAMQITQLLDDTFDYLRYDDAQDIGDYLADRIPGDLSDPEDVAEALEQLLDDNGIRASYELVSRLARKILAL
jgi:hypothetical protein